MTLTENAKVIDAQELKEMIEEKHSNPCVERLIFLETRGKDGKEGKIFPAYIEAWAHDDVKNEERDLLVFKMAIAQYVRGEIAHVQVALHEEEIGKTKRIWDKPPKKDLRNETPWVEQEVQ